MAILAAAHPSPTSPKPLPQIEDNSENIALIRQQIMAKLPTFANNFETLNGIKKRGL